MSISRIAMDNFDNLWECFTEEWHLVGGTAFRVHPFMHLFSMEFAKNLTPETAKLNLHRQLMEYGESAQIVLPLLESTRKIYEMPDTLEGKPGCKDCSLLSELVGLVVR